MSCTKIKFRWILYLNEDKIIKLTEDNKGEYILGVGRVLKKDTKSSSHTGKDWGSLK